MANSYVSPVMIRCLVVFALLASACATPRLSGQVRPVDFFVDPAGKAYLLLSDSRLVTQNKLGQTVNVFYDSSLGMPDHVDVTNPFSILVYYLDFGRLVILDRTLSEVTRIDLFATEGLQQPGALARANDNQIWVYDSWDYRLKLLDDEGQVRLRSNNLRLELGVVVDPVEIYVDRGTVALHFPDLDRLAVLTNYGRFQYWVDLPPTERVDWLTPYLEGSDGEVCWRWVAGGRRVVEEPCGPTPGRRRPTKTGYHYLDETGAVRLQQKTTNSN